MGDDRDRISRVLPRPRLLTLGGATYLVGELRLSDIADLQSWLEGVAPHPLADLPDIDEDPEPETRRRRVLSCWKAVRGWPPAYGSDAASIYLNSAAGMIAFLLVVLRRHQPAATAEDAAALASRMSLADWKMLRRTVYAADGDLWKELIAEIDPEYEAYEGKPIDWGEEFERISADRGWTYEQIGEMTIGQWRNLHAGGKRETFKMRPRPGETMKELGERTKRMFAEEAPDAGEQAVP